MAFVNAYLTEEEKEKFKAAKVRDPRWKLSEEYLIPSIWTIDKENNTALINCGVANRDKHWKQTFALVYKQIDNEHLVEITLVQRYIENNVYEKFKQQYNVELVKKWEIVDFKIPIALKSGITNQGLYRLLKEALSAYGVKGSPENDVDYIKIILEIEGTEI